MSPTIPSPTPIRGVQNLDGSLASPGPRLPLAELQANDFAFALYAQALLAWQQDGNRQKDSDATKGTSYFQVTGVHGVPFIPWQDDPTKLLLKTVGYCTHRTVLFVPWHRPYLMLYEQIIYQYALEIVQKSTGYAKKAYEDVLSYVRLPYWDFSRDINLPPAVTTPTIDIKVPGDSQGTKKTITLQHNPFYSYKFTSDYSWDLIVKELGWLKRKPQNWVQESKRCPDLDGVSHPEWANTQLLQIGKNYKARAYSLLTSVQDFCEFTTQAYQQGKSGNYDSVEAWHNMVHNYAGSNDRANDKGEKFEYYPNGNLTDVQASSFDPVFWLLHTHVDRVTAIWQAMNYQNIKIDAYKSMDDRCVARKGNLESGTSYLEPWHTSGTHDMKDYWVADSTKTLESTFAGGYYYPETPSRLRNNPDAMRTNAIQQVNALYAPERVVNMMPDFEPPRRVAAASVEQVALKKQVPQRKAAAFSVNNPQASTDNANPSSSEGPKPLKNVEWRVFIRIKAFAVPGTWGIHVFFGEPPAQSTDWLMSDNRVGTVNILSNKDLAACENCSTQSVSGLLVTGLALISKDLVKRNIDINVSDAVVEYLKDNLTWRIVKDAQNVEATPEMGLTVGVSAREVVYPIDPSELPLWGDVTVYPEATRGKVGGLESNVEEL